MGSCRAEASKSSSELSHGPAHENDADDADDDDAAADDDDDDDINLHFGLD